MKLYRTLVAAVLAASLALSVGAAFTPSVEYKDAPKVVSKTDAEGNTTIGEVKNADGVVLAVLPTGSVTLTALSAAKKDNKAANAEALLAAEKELTEAKADGDLMKAVSADLNNAPAKNIVVKDVFAVDANAAVEGNLSEGAKLTITLSATSITKADEKNITIYQKTADGAWKKVAFSIDNNNLITLVLEGTGEIAIFRDSAAAPAIAKNGPRSPKTLPIRKLH